MKALVSGQAGLAIVLTEPPDFRPVHARPFKGSLAAIGPALAHCTDIEELDVEEGDLNLLDRRLEVAWALDRALYRLYILFDPQRDPDFDATVVSELSALIRRFGIADRLNAWLERVALDPEYEQRARALAAAHRDLRDPLAHLYPSVASALEAEEAQRKHLGERRKVKSQGLSGREVRSAKHRLTTYDRSQTADERRARDLVQPILERARTALQRTGLRRARGIKPRLLRQGNHRSIVERAVNEANRAVAKAGLADRVRPFSRAEISVLLHEGNWKNRGQGDRRAESQ